MNKSSLKCCFAFFIVSSVFCWGQTTTNQNLVVIDEFEVGGDAIMGSGVFLPLDPDSNASPDYADSFPVIFERKSYAPSLHELYVDSVGDLRFDLKTFAFLEGGHLVGNLLLHGGYGAGFVQDQGYIRWKTYSDDQSQLSVKNGTGELWHKLTYTTTIPAADKEGEVVAAYNNVTPNAIPVAVGDGTYQWHTPASVAGVSVSGSYTAGTNLQMGGEKITGLGVTENPDDAASKAYVDGQDVWEVGSGNGSVKMKPGSGVLTASGGNAMAQGYSSKALGGNSVAFNQQTESIGNNSIAVGYKTKAHGAQSHAQGYETEAHGDNSHAEGRSSQATGVASHAEGLQTLAQGGYSHAEGSYTKAMNWESHAEGKYSEALGMRSHAAGWKARALHSYTFVWSDKQSPDTYFESTQDRQFSVRAQNGVRFVTASDDGVTVNGEKVYHGGNISDLLNNVGPLGDLSMGSYTNAP